MSGRRLSVILGLIALFMAGVFLVNKTLLHNGAGNTSDAGDPSTIRGVVATLLPSGKVIAVKTDKGSDVLVSLTDASLITDELGEPLFYSAVQVGMPISAAGIHGQQNNVLIPSLVTVQLARTYGGLMVASALSLRYEYFSLRYSPKLWEVGANPKELAHRTLEGCRFTAGAGPSTPDSAWKEAKIERQIGGNIFQDSSFTDNGKPVRRTLVLANAGYKYGLAESNFGEYAFQVSYDGALSAPELISCVRAVDDILETFRLRNSSAHILLVEPDIPIHVARGSTLAIEGMAQTFGNSVQGVVVDENQRVLWRGTAFVNTKDLRAFGKFSLEVRPLDPTVRAVELRVFQYSPSDGTPTDVIALPLTIE